MKVQHGNFELGFFLSHKKNNKLPQKLSAPLRILNDTNYKFNINEILKNLKSHTKVEKT
jgi:hypothetical protein